MPAPKEPQRINSKFIGYLIGLRDQNKGKDPAAFELLNIAIGQCREFNRADYKQRLALVPLMKQTRKELADRGLIL